MPMRAPQDLLTEELKSIYSAEKNLSRTLPKLAKSVSADSIRALIDRRREEGARIIEQLDQIFEELEARPGRKRNPVAEGLIEEATALGDEIDDPAMRDAAMIGALQKLENYCIAAWGTAAAFAKALNNPEAAATLSDLVAQGRQMDEEMTQLAEDEINPAMLQSDEDDDEDLDDDDDVAPMAAKSGSRGAAKNGARAARRPDQQH